MRVRTMMVATALLLSTATAHANEVRSGYWTVFDSKGIPGKFKPLCGMRTRYADVNASIYVKYIQGNENLTVHIFKEGWRFPTDQPIKFPVTVGFDKEAWGSVTAAGINDPQTGPMIEFYIANGSITNFLRDFGNASLLWIKFDEGTEQPWPAKLEGSRKAANLFSGCVLNLIGANSTQPYGNNSTQPYTTAPPTLPYAAPKKPPLNLQPALKKDEGSI